MRILRPFANSGIATMPEFRPQCRNIDHHAALLNRLLLAARQ
jgi:hypothetical protein